MSPIGTTSGEFGSPSSPAGGGSGSGTVTSVSNTDGTIVISGTPAVSPVVSRAAITGDVSIPTASDVATLAATGPGASTAGSATNSAAITIDAKGRVTGLTNTAISIPESAVINLTSDLALKAPLASPALTGSPTAPTQTPLTNNTDIATTAYADLAVGVETTRATAAEALKMEAFTAFTAVATTPIAMAKQVLYTANTGASVFNLPAVIAAGDIFGVQRGTSTAGLTITANTGQSINGGAAAGSITLTGTNAVAQQGFVLLLATSTTTYTILSAVGTDANLGVNFSGPVNTEAALTSSGGLQLNSRLLTHKVTKTANYTTLTTSDLWIGCTTNAFTVSVTTTQTGQLLFITNENTLASGNYITLAAVSGTIDNTIIPPGGGCVLLCDGTNAHTVGSWGIDVNRATATSIAGTTGTLTCSQPFVGIAYKKVLVIVSSTFASVGGVTYTFPVPFTTAPVVTSTVSGVTVATTTTTMTVTAASALGATAGICVEGA